MTAQPWTPYHYTVLRVVPHVHTGAFVNVGAIVHARTAEFLAMRAITDPHTLRALAPTVDIELLRRYLDVYGDICQGDERAGPIALLSRSERFHWLSAPRSDVLQPSPVHMGLCSNPAQALDDLFRAIRDDATPTTS